MLHRQTASPLVEVPQPLRLAGRRTVGQRADGRTEVGIESLRLQFFLQCYDATILQCYDATILQYPQYPQYP